MEEEKPAGYSKVGYILAIRYVKGCTNEVC